MDQEQRNLVAHEMQRVGFKTVLFGEMIVISLNRKVSKMEVERALEQEFEGIQFRLHSSNDCVLVW